VLGSAEDLGDGFVQQRLHASHAPHEGVHIVDLLADVVGPAATAELVFADVHDVVLLFVAD
jgi:hypothetical protein